MSYREILKEELIARKLKNPNYSLRSFARSIEMPASKLSQVLNGKSGISPKKAYQIAGHLEFTEDETEFFVTLVESLHARGSLIREAAKDRLKNRDDSFSEIDLAAFSVIRDWYYFTILEFLEIKNKEISEEEIIESLDLTCEQVSVALERLQKLNLVTLKTRGYVRNANNQLRTPTDLPSRAIKDHHSQMLIKAQDSLEKVPVEERDFSSMTLSINLDDIEEAKKWLKEFRRKFCQKLDDNPKKNAVYNLSINFFPLYKED